MADYDNVGKYTQDKLDALEKARIQLEREIAAETAGAISKATEDDDSVTVTQKGNEVNVDIFQTIEEGGIVDLKDYFKKSPNREETEGGGWHMVIPIRRYTGAKRREKSTGMTSRLYTDLLSAKPSRGYAELVSDYLYDNRRPQSPIKELNYTPKSKGITRLPINSNRHTYVSFRTVSDKSHPASWIVNRENADKSNKTQEVLDIIEKVKNYNHGGR